MMNEVFDWLLARATPTSINARDQYGATSLVRKVQAASARSNEDRLNAVLQVWLDAGVDPCLADDKGKRAEDYAIQENLLKVRALVQCQAQ